MMKTIRLLSVLILVFTLSSAYAQKVKTYKVWVTLINETKHKGILYSANEDKFVILGEDLNQINIDPQTIDVIKVRRDGSVGKGAWIGAVGGLLAGAIVGYASESGSGWEDVGAVGGGILGAPLGALIGVGVGSAKKKFILNGDRGTYTSILSKLKQYTPQQNYLNNEEK